MKTCPPAPSYGFRWLGIEPLDIQDAEGHVRSIACGTFVPRGVVNASVEWWSRAAAMGLIERDPQSATPEETEQMNEIFAAASGGIK